MNVVDMISILEVEKCGNISKAADLLGLSQPALSKTIRKVESNLDTKLFMRLPKGVLPTKEGLLHLNSFKEVLKTMNNARHQVSILRSDLTEKISVSIHPLLGKFIIPKVERELQLFPEIEINYSFQNSRDGIQDVLSGNIDMAIVADAGEYPDLIKKTLWREFVGLYSVDGKQKDTILYHSKMITAKKALKSLKFKKAKEIDDYPTIYSILKDSNFMALLPNPIVETSDKIKLIKVFKPSISVSLVYRSDMSKSKGFSKVVSLFKDKSKELLT
jgi:DNA-binding transcriptional LysR family regulator